MLTDAHERHENALRAYLGQLDHAALSRIVSAERWTWSVFREANGACCLVGHAEQLAGLSRDEFQRWHERRSEASLGASCAFSVLCHDQGIARTVAAIQLYASCLLHSREIAALTAFCPLAAREEAGV